MFCDMGLGLSGLILVRLDLETDRRYESSQTLDLNPNPNFTTF